VSAVRITWLGDDNPTEQMHSHRHRTTSIENNNRPKSYNNILAYTGLQAIRVRARITDSETA